jgi:hypothetical protein
LLDEEDFVCPDSAGLVEFQYPIQMKLWASMRSLMGTPRTCASEHDRWAIAVAIAP